MVPHVVEINPDSWNWEHDRPSLDHWMEPQLTKWGADRQPVGHLFRLSQHSIHGYEEANSIIWKLVKKMADWDPVRNHSAFISKRVENAWTRLWDIGYRHR